ncbi:iron complex transport system permease protein [Psychrobacillus psychrotolerans]|uniref:Iron complex transport system permease protein n=1 Tax=Psychrobacillus psychrotolerans TaxID=126156 RepID=A0A1I6A0H0_9BACI|nr:iron ABC transporter permease [Psychrobacillus psychrotolerans]SFQ62219.1 iron complex transport system permease protein [Psychrobacillus psychrotolerans]
MNSTTDSKKKQLDLHLPKHFTLILVIAIILLIVSIVSSLMLGARVVSYQELMDGLFYTNQDSYGANVVRKRISRTVFSLCCGVALGIAGVLMQAVTRNPLADPSILGVNTGATLFVVIGITLFNITTAGEYIWLALIGASITAVFVFGIGSMGRGGATPIKLLLAGAATSAALSSLVTAIIIPSAYAQDQFRFWQVGSVGSGNWDSIKIFLPFLIVGLLIAFISAPALNALALGDDVATSLGVRPGILRAFAIIAGVVLCGAATALAGPIGFIGLLATHAMRFVIGPDLRFLIPMSALAGAIILTFSDVVGRLIASPGELEVGILTAFIGAPILIILAKKSKVRSL